MPHITLIALANGLLQVLPDKDITSITNKLTRVSQSAAVAVLKEIVERRTGLPLNESRAVARRMIRLLKVQIRDNLAD